MFAAVTSVCVCLCIVQREKKAPPPSPTDSFVCERTFTRRSIRKTLREALCTPFFWRSAEWRAAAKRSELLKTHYSRRAVCDRRIRVPTYFVYSRLFCAKLNYKFEKERDGFTDLF